LNAACLNGYQILPNPEGNPDRHFWTPSAVE